MNRPRKYIKRLYVELDDFKTNYEELENAEDYRKIVETRTVLG